MCICVCVQPCAYSIKVLDYVCCTVQSMLELYLCVCVSERERNEELIFYYQITASAKPQEMLNYTLNKKIRNIMETNRSLYVPMQWCV